MSKPVALMEEIAAFANSLTLENISPDVIRLAKLFLIDA